MIVIFEGADDTGKTTVAKKLAEDLRIPYFKNSSENSRFEMGGKFFKNVYIETKYCLDFLEQVKPNVVFDRHIPSEYAYAKNFDRSHSEFRIFQADARLAELGVKLIYFYKPNLYKKSHKLYMLTHYYCNYLVKTKMKYLSIDTTDENIKLQLYYIKHFLEV